MSVNPEEDFSNYMEHMAAAEMEAAKDQAMIDAHNVSGTNLFESVCVSRERETVLHHGWIG